MIKLVAFDWNGTLFADTKASLDADNNSLKLLGIKPVSLFVFQSKFEVPVVDYYVNLGLKRDQLLKKSKQIEHIFHKYYEKRVSKIRTRRNTKKLLSFLKKNKIKSIIFSNHTVDGISIQLKRLKIGSYFSKVLANSELDAAFKGVRKEKNLRDYVKLSGFKPKEILVIGDTTEEIEIGKNLGVITVAITDGYYSTPRLKAAKPDYLIGNLSQIIPIIERLSAYVT